MHTGASLQRLLHSDEKGTLASTLVCRHSTQVQLVKFSMVRGTQRTNFVIPCLSKRLSTSNMERNMELSSWGAHSCELSAVECVTDRSFKA